MGISFSVDEKEQSESQFASLLLIHRPPPCSNGHVAVFMCHKLRLCVMSSSCSRLDYCNSHNIAKQDLSKRQRLQNCLARVVLGAPRFSPSLPLLKQLHWLPVNYRIKFKLSTLTYRARVIHQPPYLTSPLHFSNIPGNSLSSTSQQQNKTEPGQACFLCCCTHHLE